MTLIPGIKQISQVGNDMYIQGAFPVSIVNTDVSYLSDPADTRLLAGRDPVIEEVSVGMSGTETGIKTATGAAPLQITDAMQGMLRFLETNIKPVQDLHGYANPWPAGGGKNLLDPTKRQNLSSNIYIYYNTTGLLLKAGVTYTFSVSSATAQNSIEEIGGPQLIANYGRTSLTYTPSTDVYVWFNAYFAGNYPPPSGGTSEVQCQLEIGSTATDFAPYSNICPISGWTGCNVYVSPTTNQADATVYPCTWQDDAGTVYGGKIDLISGWMTVTMAEVDLGSNVFSWTYDNSGKRWQSTLNGLKSFAARSADILSEKYKSDITASAGSENVMFTVGGAIYIYYSDSINPPSGQLVYPLATPQDIQVPGNQILTQEGTNYIWTDCGDTITAAYVAVK